MEASDGSTATPGKLLGILDEGLFEAGPYNRGMSESAALLPDDPALCHEIIRQQADTIRELQRRIAQLEQRVEQLLRRQASGLLPRFEEQPGFLGLQDRGTSPTVHCAHSGPPLDRSCHC